jgi:hypothetical protein
MSRNAWMILGCIAFEEWSLLDESTNQKANIDGIIATQKGESSIEFERYVDGTSLGTSFLIGSAVEQFTGV